MIVCHCRGVSSTSIEAVVAEGVADTDEIAACSGAGTDCGGCLPLVEAIVDEARSEHQPSAA